MLFKVTVLGDGGVGKTALTVQVSAIRKSVQEKGDRADKSTSLPCRLS